MLRDLWSRFAGYWLRPEIRTNEYAMGTLTFGALSMAYTAFLAPWLFLWVDIGEVEKSIEQQQLRLQALEIAESVQAGELPVGFHASVDVAYAGVYRLGSPGTAAGWQATSGDAPVRLRDLALGLCAVDGHTDVVDGWYLACQAYGPVQVVALRPIQSNSVRWSFGLGMVVLAFGAAAGLFHGVLSQGVTNQIVAIADALERVIQGERAIDLPKTSFIETNDLVDVLEQAVDAIQAREAMLLRNAQVVQEMSRLVAHEVRNPLQSLELLTSLIVHEETREERAKLGASIQTEIRMLDEVVVRLLRRRPSQEGIWLDRRTRPIAELIQGVVRLRASQAKAQGVRLEVAELPDRELRVDKALLRRALDNLIINALQALGESAGSRIRLSVEDASESELQISVEDDGPGIPEAIQDSLFEANVSGRSGGTGLGLALVRGVVEAHGGWVEVERSSLGGARFSMYLPQNGADPPTDIGA